MSDGRHTETFSRLLPDEVERLAHRVLERARELDLSIATAESCTGGLVAAVLTDVKDLSGRVERAFVVYSPHSKCELLGVEPALIEEHGAVSRPVAEAMAVGALARSRADVTVALTGYADEGDEPGLVHLASAADGRLAHRVERFGPIGRGPVRIGAVGAALEMLLAALEH